MSQKLTGSIKKYKPKKKAFKSEKIELLLSDYSKKSESNDMTFCDVSDLADWIESNANESSKFNFNGHVVGSIFDTKSTKPSLIGNDCSTDQLYKFIDIFSNTMIHNPKEALTWVFTLSVFLELTENTFDIGDEVHITNIQGPKMFVKRPQAKVDSISSLKKIESISSDEELAGTSADLDIF